MRNLVSIFIILLLFIIVLIVAYSDWGKVRHGGVDDASARDRFSTKRFPATSGSGLKPLLPQELPALKALPQQKIDRERSDYEKQRKVVTDRTLEQQKESDRRARHKRPRR